MARKSLQHTLKFTDNAIDTLAHACLLASQLDSIDNEQAFEFYQLYKILYSVIRTDWNWYKSGMLIRKPKKGAIIND